MQWSEDDKVFSGTEKRIAEEWGLNKAILDGLHERIKTYRISSPNAWFPPPRLVFKLNFDGVARGNSRAAGFGGTCRNSEGEILHIFFGSIGKYTSNTT